MKIRRSRYFSNVQIPIQRVKKNEITGKSVQTEEQDKSPELTLKKQKLDREFKITVIKILTDIRRKMPGQYENFNKETENLQKSPT